VRGGDGRLSFQDRLRPRLGFGKRSVFEEVFAQRSFEIGNELADDLSLRHAESCGCGVADRLKFMLDAVLGLRRCFRWMLDSRMALCATAPGRKFSPRKIRDRRRIPEARPAWVQAYARPQQAPVRVAQRVAQRGARAELPGARLPPQRLGQAVGSNFFDYRFFDCGLFDYDFVDYGGAS